MKKITFILIPILIISFFSCQPKAQDKEEVTPKAMVTVDYQMAEKAIQWLEFVKTNPGMENIRQRFMEEVAPTKGCQSIIHHWERFKEWDTEKFYTFIMEALQKIPTDKPLKNEDGSLTSFGMRQKLWISALENTDQLKQDLHQLKKAQVKDAALSLARKYLPDDADISNQFYVVLFGASSAFSVGEENGYDLLQLPETPTGEVYVENVIETFAHEMHHSGFSSCTEKHMTDVEDKEKLFLVELLAAEGMPTHFINQVRSNLNKMKSSKNEMYQMLASQWEKNLDRLPELYQEAEKDVMLNMKGEITPQEILEKWMSGLQGPAYVVGSDMFAVIENHLGLEEAKKVAQDYRHFLSIYNQAAEKAHTAGQKAFIFDKKVAEQLQEFTGGN